MRYDYDPVPRYGTRRYAGDRAFSGVVGVLLAPFIGMFLSWWSCTQAFQTEAHAVRVEEALSLGSRDVQALNDGNAPQMQNKLAYFTGAATMKSPAKDSETGVTAPVICLRRHIQMYQWHEDYHSTKHSHYYTYRTGWDDDQINSNHFHDSSHANPRFPFGSRNFNALCSINGHIVPSDLLDKLPAAVPLNPVPLSFDLYRVTAAVRLPCRRMGEYVYIGNSPQVPQVGDMQINYTVAPVGALSIVASEQRNTFAPFWEKNGESVYLIEPGTVPVQNMFKDAMTANQVELNGKRILWFVLTWIGLLCMWAPIKSVLDIVPFFGAMIDWVIIPLSAVAAVFLNGIIIIASWFVLRPMFSIAVFAALLVTGAVIMSFLQKQSDSYDTVS